MYFTLSLSEIIAARISHKHCLLHVILVSIIIRLGLYTHHCASYRGILAHYLIHTLLGNSVSLYRDLFRK